MKSNTKPNRRRPYNMDDPADHAEVLELFQESLRDVLDPTKHPDEEERLLKLINPKNQPHGAA